MGTAVGTKRGQDAEGYSDDSDYFDVDDMGNIDDDNAGLRVDGYDEPHGHGHGDER